MSKMEQYLNLVELRPTYITAQEYFVHKDVIRELRTPPLSLAEAVAIDEHNFSITDALEHKFSITKPAQLDLCARTCACILPSKTSKLNQQIPHQFLLFQNQFIDSATTNTLRIRMKPVVAMQSTTWEIRKFILASWISAEAFPMCSEQILSLL